MRLSSRYLRFTLRHLLVVTTIACVLLAWVAALRNHRQLVNRAIHEAQMLGGVCYLRNGDESSWGKLRNWLAGGPIPCPVNIHFQRQKPGHKAWGPYGPDGRGVLLHQWDAENIRKLGPVFRQLPELVNLSFWDSRLPEEVLYDILPSSEQLKYLGLEGTLVGSKDLCALARVPNLERLDLSSTNVDDGDMQHVAGLMRLKLLRLENTRVTDVGLKQLNGLRNMERVDLGLTRVTPAIIPMLIDWQVSRELLVPAEWPLDTVASLQASLPHGCDVRRSGYEFRHRPGSLALLPRPKEQRP